MLPAPRFDLKQVAVRLLYRNFMPCAPDFKASRGLELPGLSAQVVAELGTARGQEAVIAMIEREDERRLLPSDAVRQPRAGKKFDEFLRNRAGLQEAPDPQHIPTARQLANCFKQICHNAFLIRRPQDVAVRGAKIRQQVQGGHAQGP